MRKYLITLALFLPSPALAGWPVVGGSGGGGGLDPANNLCDVDDSAAALVCIGAQAQGDILDDLNTLGAAGSANQCIYSDGAGSFAYASCTATGLAVMAAADAAAARTAIDAQQESEPLTGISALGSTPANRFLYTVGLDTWLDGIITSDGVAILGGAGAANLAFNPAVATDWDGDADPGETDDALNQLAERVDDNEAVLSGLGALATGDDASDVSFVCAVDANWTGGLCPGTSAASLDDLASRVNTLEGATVDAADVTFTPTTVGDWTGDADPGDVDEALDDLAGRVETLEGAGGGSGDSVELAITQAAHGLSVGDWVRLSGADYIEAQANSATNAEVVGVVSAVADVNNFTLQRHGHVTGLSGLTAGTLYFLDASTAGAITATEPTGSNVSKPVLQADSTTSGWIIEMRGTIAQATAGWDWAQAVSSPAASDWTDASSAGADVSMTAISDGTVGDYVILNPGASTTDQYGVTMAAAAGDWVWCARISRMTANGSGAVTTATIGMDFVLVAAFVDGADVDNATWNGAGLIGGAQDWNGSDVGSVSGPGSGSDRWDGALVAGEVQDFMGWSTADVCLERSGTDLVAWIGQRAGGFQRADSWTVSANAGLYAIVLRDVDAAHHHRVRLDAYGLLSAVPGLE